jgi:hypothetical protein
VLQKKKITEIMQGAGKVYELLTAISWKWWIPNNRKICLLSSYYLLILTFGANLGLRQRQM